MKTISFLLLVFIPFLAIAQSWTTYPYHEEGAVLYFPEDEGYHPAEPIEWWYTNARVTGQTTGTDYSFMLTYFYYPAFTWQGFRILNLANEDTGVFYDETLPATYPVLAQDHLEITANVGFTGSTTETWATKTDGQGNLIPWEYHLSASGTYGALELDYKALKRPLMVGGTGFLNQGANNYTYYYSQTLVEVTGTLTFDGFTEPVSGIAWIDRQFGDFNPNIGEPYEWFSLQLSNGMDINLWNVFTFENQIPDTSTYRIFTAYVDDSTTVWNSDFGLERLAFDWSADGEVCYSQKWRFTSDALDLDLIMTVNHPDQEVTLPFRFYEGSTNIEGTVGGQPVTGQGFAELLHQYENPQIGILAPQAGNPWDPSQPISWSLLNPDDGRAVYYDVAVSNDDKTTWTTIAEGLTETEFLWNATGWPGDSLYWFRITGSSIDGILSGTAETETAFSILSGTVALPAAPIVRIFPNPASGRVVIQSDEGQWLEVRLHDASGQFLRKVAGVSPLKLDLQNLAEGIYWLSIQNQQGIRWEKLLLQKK
ncbi:MAG: T9SS type A sorting domain-containing protein [Lewinellaceae bacterium]|nr:T9SS type A sorting domain-containing protein [Lewinellaceae bacterium]